MNKSLFSLCLLLCAGIISVSARPAASNDWPAFQDLSRRALPKKPVLLKEWPEGGRLWPGKPPDWAKDSAP